MPDTQIQTVDLSAMQWRRRPLLIFSPTVDHDGYVRQKQMLAAQQSGVIDRDVAVIEVVHDDAGYIDDQPLDPASAAQLRSAFKAGVDDFTVILVGKDGTPKLRERRAVPTHELFSLIDSMPMRQSEMRRSD